LAGSVVDQTRELVTLRDSMSEREHDPPKGATFNEVAQSFSRFLQREGLRHDRPDRPGPPDRGHGIVTLMIRSQWLGQRSAFAAVSCIQKECSSSPGGPTSAAPFGSCACAMVSGLKVSRSNLISPASATR
jgi:hypothetical protein